MWAEGIQAILIKGWSNARFCPNSYERSFSVVDIVVEQSLCAVSKKIANQFKETVLGIDLHCGFGDRDLLSWDELYSNSQLLDLEGVPIRVLGDEDNLRLTSAHWLIDGAVYRDHLWDIYHQVNNRKPDFDWDRCLNAAGPARRTWVLAAIATARDYLDLDVSDLPDQVKEFELPKWYVTALEHEWTLGPYLRIPISHCLGQPKVLIGQARRRFPPNPIAATTDTESSIDESPRFKYQTKSFLKKLRKAISGLQSRLASKP